MKYQNLAWMNLLFCGFQNPDRAYKLYDTEKCAILCSPYTADIRFSFSYQNNSFFFSVYVCSCGSVCLFMCKLEFVYEVVCVCERMNEHMHIITIATSHTIRLISSILITKSNRIVVVKSFASRLNTTILKAVNCHHVTENWRTKKKTKNLYRARMEPQN